jgi:outer membrane protein TolC
MRSLILISAAVCAAVCGEAQAGALLTPNLATNASGAYVVDLTTVLKLADARNLDLQIAHQTSSSAEAAEERALWNFFPFLEPGVGYHHHENRLQNSNGTLSDVSSQNITPGVVIAGQIDIGDSTYRLLAARQSVAATHFAESAQREESVTTAIIHYFELSRSSAAVEIAGEAVRIATNYLAQIQNARQAGLALKGDELRVQVQAGRAEVGFEQALTRERLAGTVLAQSLHLDPAITLVAASPGLSAFNLLQTNAPVTDLLSQAMVQRPELAEVRAEMEAARELRQNSVYGPLFPSLSAIAFLGGMGGGQGGNWGDFNQSEDFSVFLGWRIGPNGLFDPGRRKAAEAQLERSKLTNLQIQDLIRREVVDAYARFQSLATQITIARSTLANAVEAEKLAETRKQYAVGEVFEDIQTQLDLTAARNEYLAITTEFNQVQFLLTRAIGLRQGSNLAPAAR